jgi:dienelactone hydrolase
MTILLSAPSQYGASPSITPSRGKPARRNSLAVAVAVLPAAHAQPAPRPPRQYTIDRVKKNGVPVENVVFPDEGHGFLKKKNQIEGYRKILEFLDRYLKGA